MSIILASSSPRRQQLLAQVGCNFSVVTSDVEEDNSLALPPDKLAVHHAVAKAKAVAALARPDDVIIGADTIVVLDGQVFGKPVDELAAKQMLTALAGRTHTVMTGVAVIGSEMLWTDVCRTDVCMMQLTAGQIDQYVATGEPMDKAGAYAIQGVGTMLIEGIQGCYTNVVGLPLNALHVLLKKAGVDLL